MLVLLYCRFPSEAFKDYLQVTAAGVFPQHVLLMEKVRPSFPVGLKLVQTTISARAKPDMNLFAAESILIRPVLWSFLQGKSKYNFACHAYGGDLSGCVHFTENSAAGPFTASIELQDVCVDNYTGFPSLVGSNIKALLNGGITYSGRYGSFIEGTGQGHLTVSDGRINFSQPILIFDSIDFDELLINFVLKGQKIELSHVQLKGREIQGTLSGNISLKKDFLRSTLNMKGSIEPFPAFFKNLENTPAASRFLKQPQRNNRFSFVIYGTLKDPKLKFI